MSMVDDLDMFNSYPWGTVVYDTTVDSLRGKDMAEKYRKRLRKPPPQTATGRQGDVHLIRFPFRISGYFFLILIVLFYIKCLCISSIDCCDY